MKKIVLRLVCIIALSYFSCSNKGLPNNIFLGLGMMAGEVTENSVVLQSRLCSSDSLINGHLPGTSGVGFFEISTDNSFKRVIKTDWLSADSSYDYMLKSKINGLAPGTRYFYRLNYGTRKKHITHSRVGSFKTLQTDTGTESVSFVVVTGMNYARHFYGRHDGHRKSWEGYNGPDRDLGFPALKTVLDMKPDYFIGTGDNIYYDRNSPGQKTAETLPEMRQRWHEQFIQPRFIDMFANIPTYWEKDDHDHRYNDSDTTANGKLPGHRLAVDTFLEQVPVVDPLEKGPKTFRTRRLNKHVQLWFTEGRDYRSPNNSKDGPDKTMWGSDQFSWLKSTLAASDATFKILVSPTPLVGPDDWGQKCDNHLNCYRHERAEFFEWLVENGFNEKNFIIICGDRHWQYHAVDPTGIHEYSTGAFVDGNARLGVETGAPTSTDPNGLIKQLYLQGEPSGGFLRVSIDSINTTVVAQFTHYDENGAILYSHKHLADN